MLLKFKHLQTSHVSLSALKKLNSHVFTYKTYIQEKTKDKKTLTTTKWALKHFQRSELPKRQPLKIHSIALKQLNF